MESLIVKKLEEITKILAQSFGWDNYLKAYFSDSIDTKEARKIEEIKWWLKSRTPKEKSNSRTSANSQNIP